MERLTLIDLIKEFCYGKIDQQINFTHIISITPDTVPTTPDPPPPKKAHSIYPLSVLEKRDDM